MPPTVLTAAVRPTAYATAGLIVPLRPSDTANQNAFTSTGREWLLAYNADAGTNDVQTLTSTGTVSGGTFTWTFGGQTATIPWNATPQQTQALLEALSSIGLGNVAVTGSALPAGPQVVTFIGTLAGTAQAAATISNALLTGTTPVIVNTHTTTGSGGTAHTLTITSVADPGFGRTGNFGPFSIPPGNICTTQLFPQSGWAAGGLITFTTDSPLVRVAVIQNPY